MNASILSEKSPKRDVMETWFQRVWTEGDQTVIDKMFPASGKATGLGDQRLVGPTEFKRFHTALCSLIDNIHITISHSIEEGDWISNLIVINAVSKISGVPVEFTGNTYSKIDVEKGLILEGYNNIDFMSLWNQMGILPPNVFKMVGI